MSWVKEANKLGKYEWSYKGFRIYCTKEPSVTESIDSRSDGDYRITNFHRGEYVAIDRNGVKLTANNFELIGWEIDKEIIIRWANR